MESEKQNESHKTFQKNSMLKFPSFFMAKHKQKIRSIETEQVTIDSTEKVTQSDLLKSTDNLESKDQIDGLSDDGVLSVEDKSNDKKKSIDELCFEQVVNDGETTQLYDLGPFGFSVLEKIIRESIQLDIPICIVKKKKVEKVNLTKQEEVKQLKLVNELHDIYKELGPYVGKNTKCKKYKQIIEKKEKVQAALNRLNNSQNNYSYHLYVNCSRIDFVDRIRSDSYPLDIHLQETHASMVSSAFEMGTQFCNLETMIDTINLDVPGNYGGLAVFEMEGKDFFETHLHTKTYYNFRKQENCPSDHIALRYSNIDQMRVLFETNRLIDYVFYLCRAKDIEEEIYIQYVHANQDLYKTLDFSELPCNEIKSVSDWEMPLSFLKLRNILKYCSEKECPVSYRICLPKGDLTTKDGFKRLKVIVRTTLNLSEFA